VRRRYAVERHNRLLFYVFISPWLLGFFLFTVVPIGWGFYVSLTNRMAFSVRPKFTGIGNYLDLITDGDIRYSFATTFGYAIEATILAILTGFFLALLLEKKIRGRSIFRIFFCFPYMIPLVAVGWIFRIFLERDTGFLNVLLTRFGLISSRIDWLSRFPRGSIVGLSFWSAGWSMLIFLGALSTVPEELYEVAKIDGAGYFRRLRHITLPLISPFIFFLTTVSMIYSLQVFLEPFLLNPYRAPAGGQVIAGFTPKETMFVMAKAYIDIIGYGRWGYGHALLWLLFVLILLLTLVLYRLRFFWVYTEIDDKKG